MSVSAGTAVSRSTRTADSEQIELSVVFPCLNEERTLAACIEQAQRTFAENGISAEIVVADNGSTDSSADIAATYGARVIPVQERGYGSALRGGIEAARGRYVLMADPDGSYDLRHIPRFLEQLRSGADLVMGNRFVGGVEDGAMPRLHRYLGNPVLTGVGRLLFKADCGDFHCGIRAFSKAAYDRMSLRTTGMEFASEMVVKASVFGMRVAEVPTTLSPDGRNRPPHLRSWRDGWRHLRFLLMYSPRWLFLYPGALLIVLGTLAAAYLLPGPKRVGSVVLDVHSLLYAAMAVLIGFQCVAFAMFTKVFAISEGLLPEDPRLNRLFRYFTLEVGLAVGAVLLLVGIITSVWAVVSWGSGHFGPLDPAHVLRIVIPAVLTTTLGCNVIFASFFLSILGMRRQ